MFNKTNALNVTKFVVRMIVMSGTATIVHDVIEKNVDIESTSDQVAVGVASFAIGGVVADAAGKYTDALIDDINELFTGETKKIEDPIVYLPR